MEDCNFYQNDPVNIVLSLVDGKPFGDFEFAVRHLHSVLFTTEEAVEYLESLPLKNIEEFNGPYRQFSSRANLRITPPTQHKRMGLSFYAKAQVKASGYNRAISVVCRGYQPLHQGGGTSGSSDASGWYFWEMPLCSSARDLFADLDHIHAAARSIYGIGRENKENVDETDKASYMVHTKRFPEPFFTETEARNYANAYSRGTTEVVTVRDPDGTVVARFVSGTEYAEAAAAYRRSIYLET